MGPMWLLMFRRRGAKKTPLYKICHTYSAIMKHTIPKEDPKILYESRLTHIGSGDISIFLPEISKFFYINKYRYRLNFNTQPLILLSFFECLIIVLINMVTILMISLKMTNLGFVKIKVFLKGYDVIINITTTSFSTLSFFKKIMVLSFTKIY